MNDAAAPPGPLIFGTDIEDQTANNYLYDQIGNLTADDTEEIAYINWTVDNKIRNIYRIEGSEKPDLEFVYDASGVRICKIVKPKNPGGTPKGENEWTYTYYVTDATGNVVATYDRSLLPSENPAFDFKDQLVLSELHLFGSSRLGMIKPGAVKNRMLEASVSETPVTVYSDESNTIVEYLLTGIDYGELSGLVKENTGLFRITAGKKVYELTNHLGNVNGIISDQKIAIEGASGEVDYYSAEILSITDYYAFGSPMYGRDQQISEYRYGFQNQETDQELWNGAVAYKYRVEDPRLRRFFSVDPLTAKYPFYSKYSCSGNRLLDMIELEGLEQAEPEGYDGEEKIAPVNEYENTKNNKWLTKCFITTIPTASIFPDFNSFAPTFLAIHTNFTCIASVNNAR